MDDMKKEVKDKMNDMENKLHEMKGRAQQKADDMNQEDMDTAA